MPRRKACDHAPEGSVSESAVSRNTRSSERRNIPEAGRPEEPGRCKLPLARSLQLRSVRRQHRNSFEMPHFRFLIRADSVQVFFFCLVFIKLLPYAKRKERCLCEDQRRRTAKFAPCGEDNIPAGLCTASKQNRIQALVCKNHERSITLETTRPTDMNSARPPERNLIRNGRSATKMALNFTARTVVFPKAVYRNHAGGNTVSTQSSRTLPGVTLTTISVTCSGVKLIMFPEFFRKTLDFEPDWEYDCLGKILFPSTLNRFDCTRR